MTGLLISRGGNQLSDFFNSYAGIYHVAGQGGVSRFEWARAILEIDSPREEQKTKRVEPALSSEFPTPATRPA